MSVEQFGYEDQLDRALTLGDLIVYGMIFMVPIAPFAVFGFVWRDAKGMVALAYLIGLTGMLFTALSYAAMSRAFPLAGSVYAYVQRGLHETAGFLAGWLILLDYILIPALLYLFSAVALRPLLPGIPAWAWLVGFVAFNAGANVLGVRFTARLYKVLLALELLTLALFVTFAALALHDGDGAGRLTLAPLYDPRVFSLTTVAGATSIAVLSFLGFDGISTLSEESAGTRNAIARAMHWRHDDGPRPTIIFVHGFTGSPYRFNSEFFQLPWFYRHGCDVVMAVLPFHGRRNDLTGPFDGSGLFSDGMATFTEAMLQSVTDLRVLVDYLESTGVERIGITGLSLGGYVTALMAATEPRLHFAVPNCAVTDLGALMDGWFPAGALIGLGLRLSRLDAETHREAIRLHSPLRFPAVLPPDRLLIIGGLADRLSPPEQSARLWEHWERPRIHWFPGSHLLHLRRAVYLREIGRFLRETRFSPG